MSSFVSADSVSERIQPIGTELGTICSPEGPSSVPSLLVPPANEETSFLLLSAHLRILVENSRK